VRVIVDTNIFVSSFFGGHPRRIIDLWKKGLLILCLTNTIIDEYIDVLRRMGLPDDGELDELLLLFKRQYNCVFTGKTCSLNVCTDVDDNKFIEAAVTLKARFIVSGDKHLKSLIKYADIEILSPKDFLDRLR